MNANQEFVEENFPAHTPTLWLYKGKDEMFFGGQNGMTSGPSSGTHIKVAMRRLRERVRKTDPKTL